MLRARTPSLNGYTATGTLGMLAGSAIYFADQAHQGHSWHLFQWPGLAVAALGVVLAYVGTLPPTDDD